MVASPRPPARPPIRSLVCAVDSAGASRHKAPRESGARRGL